MPSCTICTTPLSGGIDTFGHPESPLCVLCFMDPDRQTDDDPGPFQWIDSSEKVRVPKVECPDCHQLIRAEVDEWETDTRKPTEGGVLLWCGCEAAGPVPGEERYHNAMKWVMRHVRVLPEPVLMIPGMIVPKEWIDKRYVKVSSPDDLPAPAAFVGQCPLCGKVLAMAMASCSGLQAELGQWAASGMVVSPRHSVEGIALEGCIEGCSWTPLLTRGEKAHA